ncbi:kinase domain-containing [Cordyceps militaris]|uniref:non-specific serine/threonine protein kinase n=1 Tax=Cordyceps militaris TaxID=73501 RepID=A0A2H4SB45_CORMI|nr:kinase domain-containing [Cordyceps militaris]
MSSKSSFESYPSPRFLLPEGVEDTEDVENYEPGGFHPVHLGDTFDDGRYRIVHKLGAGGFSTVWLARDEKDKKWVALKIVAARHSIPTAEKSSLTHAMLPVDGKQRVVVHRRQFTFDGPNGHHLCLILPVLGPSMSDLSYHWNCRLTPWMARRAAYQAVRAVADLHSQGLCHGGQFPLDVFLLNFGREANRVLDVTTGNLLLGMIDIDCYEENDIYDLFGRPVTGVLETENGEMPGPEAPRYIVGNIDFLSAPSDILELDIKLMDFDQCFPISSPPSKMLGTPVDFLAPEVAMGLEPGPASDVWALGCCIFRLRAGDGPFSSPFEVTCPADLVGFVLDTLGGDVPPSWQDTLWDSRGMPTKDASKGKPLKERHAINRRPLRDLVYKIWDEPNGRAIHTGSRTEEQRIWLEHEHQPFQSSWSKMAWNPTAIRVDDVGYLSGYNRRWNTLLALLPKIPDREAALLYDLMLTIFVYDPARRPTAKELLEHPYFHLDGPEE